MSYKIEIKILGGLSEKQITAFDRAARKWEQVIVGELPSGTVSSGPFEGQVIKNLAISAEGKHIDGSGGILGQAGPLFIRTNSNLPITGMMEFDIEDLNNMENDGTLEGVIVHEMGHVIGIGTLWETMGLVKGLHTNNPIYIGESAIGEYAALRKSKTMTPIPIANTGGGGTFGGHWRETTFDRELMTGYVDIGGMPLSRMTVAALADMGYEVDKSEADDYQLPPAAFNLINRSHLCRQSGRIQRPLRSFANS